MRKEYIEAGKIVTTHGVKGEVKLYPWCDDPEMFLDIETIYLDAKGQKPMTLEGVRFAKEMPLLKLEGIHSIDDAAKLGDKIIYIHRDDIPDAASRLIGKRGCNGGLIRTLRQPAGQHIRLIDSPVIQRADCNADLMIVYFRMYRLTVDADRIRDTVQCL